MSKGIVAFIVFLVIGFLVVGGLAISGLKEVGGPGETVNKPADEPKEPVETKPDEKQDDVIVAEPIVEDDYVPPPVAEMGPVGPYLRDESVPFEDADNPENNTPDNIPISENGRSDMVISLDGLDVLVVTKNKLNYLRLESQAFIDAKAEDFTSFKVNDKEYIQSDRFGFNEEKSRLIINETGSNSDEILEDISKKGVNNFSFIFKDNEYSGDYEVKEVE